MPPTVLITGCSTGIGRETAHAFLSDGWDVYATARNRTDIEGLREYGANTVELDLTSDADAERVVDRVVDETGHIDCLINNAGYGQFGPVEDVPTEKVRRQFDVHVFGPHRLMRAALPYMRMRGAGRIINVSSAVGNLSVAGIGVYTASKFALEGMNDALRQEVSQKGVDVVLVQPGIVATDFYDRAVAEIEGLEQSRTYDDLYRILESIEFVERAPPGVNRPQRVAQTILTAASVADPEPRYRVGPSAQLGTLAGLALTGRRRDRATQLGISLFSNEILLELLREGAALQSEGGSMQ